MNIDDVKTLEYPAGCWLEAIFKRQHELTEKYIPIEKESGLLQTEDMPVKLHSKEGQARLKDFAWRFTEELGEAHECLQQHKNNSLWYKLDSVHHFREELADALHFLTEMTLMAGLTADHIVEANQYAVKHCPSLRLDLLLNQTRRADTPKMLYTAGFDVVVKLGIACNFLKNKPWKQTHMYTDENRFKAKLVLVWKSFFQLLRKAGFDAKMVHDYYFKKSEVNKFRQRSKY